MQALEGQIHALEVALEGVSAELQAAGALQDYPGLQQAGQTYAELQARLEELLDEWEALARET